MKAISYSPMNEAAAILGIGLMALLPACSRNPAPVLAAAPGLSCPQWVKFPADLHSGADSPFLGCASKANLRAMVADQSDLEQGKPTGPSDGERETRAIEAYRQGKVKPFQGTSASGAGSNQSSSAPSVGGSQ